MDGPDEHIDVDVDDVDRYLRKTDAQIRFGRARFENWIGGMLILALVFSLPLYGVLVFLGLERSPNFSVAFERWYAVVGPLAGAALGIGFSRVRER